MDFFFNLFAILNCMHHKRCLKMDAKKDARKTMFMTSFFSFLIPLWKIAILNCMHHKRCLKMDAKKDAKKTMFMTFFFFFFPLWKIE